MAEQRPALEVYVGGRLTGHLRDAGGMCSFTYLDDPTVPLVSANLPWQPTSYPAAAMVTRAVIEGWLPEEGLRVAQARQLGVSSADPYALLAELGRDCAGAIQVLRPGAVLEEPSVRWLDAAELVEIIDKLPVAPLGPSRELEVRASLAGVQGKLAVVVDGDRVGLPRGNMPSTHILKPEWRRGPDDASWPDMVANEAYCMRVSAALGLATAEVRPVRVGDRPVLQVTRFDRRVVDGVVERVHQEDLAQITGHLPAEKYEGDNGASLLEVADGLRRAGVALLDALPALLDAIVIAAAIGNADQHAKNLAVVYDRDGPRLAPLYDLVSTMVYDDLSTRSAFRVGDEIYIDDVGPRACIAEAVNWRVPERQARARVDAVVDRLPEAAAQVLEAAAGEGWVCPTVERIAELVTSWANRTS